MRPSSWVLLLVSAALAGQTSALPEFEVASLKPSNADLLDVNSHVPDLNVEHGRVIRITNITLKDTLMLAYKLGAAQISGPPWMINRFDIVAKVPADATKAQIPLMLQALLAERFRLKLHYEKKELPVYALVVGGRGPKLRVGDGNGGCTRSYAESDRVKITGGTFTAACHGVSAATLVQAMQTMAPNYFDRPVVDATGLTGTYDFTLDWISFSESMSGAPGPTIFSAVQQLGLNLEKRKQAVDILVIDHCEKEPLGN